MPTPELAPCTITLSPALRRPGGDQRVVQRVEPDRQRRGLLEAHAVRDFHGAAVVADREFGVAAGRMAHHPVAHLEVACTSAPTSITSPENSLPIGLPAAAPWLVSPLRRAEVGAVERDGLDLDQDVGRFRLRLPARPE